MPQLDRAGILALVRLRDQQQIGQEAVLHCRQVELMRKALMDELEAIWAKEDAATDAEVAALIATIVDVPKGKDLPWPDDGGDVDYADRYRDVPDKEELQEQSVMMTPRALLKRIRRLDSGGPVTASVTKALQAGKPSTTWYKTQKEHWGGWLRGYDGPGYYGRKNPDREAEYIYNHIQCAPMLLWLAEAAGMPRKTLLAAKRAVLAAGPSCARQCASLRRVIPWAEVRGALEGR